MNRAFSALLKAVATIALAAAGTSYAIPAKGQSQPVPVYTNTDITASKKYTKGNVYQKDFLLFMDMIQTCHPAFAPGSKAPLKTGRITRKGYRWAAGCRSDSDFRLRLQKIIGKLNDGHSMLIPNLDYNSIYPFAIAPVGDGFILQAADRKDEASLGKKVMRINGADINDVLESFRPMMSCENEYFFKGMAGTLIQFASIWEDTRYEKDDGTLTLLLEDNTEITLKAVPKNSLDIVWLIPEDNGTGIFRKSKQLFSYRIYPEMDLCYMEFNACSDRNTMRSQIYSQGLQHKLSEKEIENRLAQIPRFDEFAEKMFRELEEKNIGTLVIDVRENAGGNSVIGDILLSWLIPADSMKTYTSSIRFSSLWKDNYPKLSNEYEEAFAKAGIPMVMGNLYDSGWISSIIAKDTATENGKENLFRMNESDSVYKGRVFILQGNRTYSSAGMFVTTAHDNGVGTVIGEHSTYRPSNYGDILSWKLPNTGTRGYMSHKIFHRPDISRDSDTDLTPDILINVSTEDLRSGTDPYEKYILENVIRTDD